MSFREALLRSRQGNQTNIKSVLTTPVRTKALTNATIVSNQTASQAVRLMPCSNMSTVLLVRPTAFLWLPQVTRMLFIIAKQILEVESVKQGSLAGLSASALRPLVKP